MPGFFQRPSRLPELPPPYPPRPTASHSVYWLIHIFWFLKFHLSHHAAQSLISLLSSFSLSLGILWALQPDMKGGEIYFLHSCLSYPTPASLVHKLFFGVNRHLFPHDPGGHKVQINVSAGLIPPALQPLSLVCDGGGF